MDEINQLLTSNPQYQALMNEFDGPHMLTYVYRNITFWVFNEVGGSVYVAIAPDSIREAYENQEETIRFAEYAKRFFDNLRQ